MNCHMLTSLPDEVFIQATFGNMPKKCPCEAIKTFSQLSLVCLAANEKVNLVWKQIIQHSDLIAYLYPSSKDKLEKPKEFLKLNYETLKKWSYLNLSKTRNIDLQKWRTGDPEISESMIFGFMEQCVLHNYQKNPELWGVMSLPRTNLVCVDLMTQMESVLPLTEQLNPVSYKCRPCMALSDSWIAICSDLIAQNSMEIAIIDKSSGSRLHTISDLGKVLKIECEGNYLYVLCQNNVEECKFLQYDSYDWESLPKELKLPEEAKIYTFYIGTNELLFSTAKQNRLFAISKEDCFSNKEPSFITQEIEAEYPKIQVCEDGFYILSKESDYPLISKGEDEYEVYQKSECVLVSRLCITHAVINSIPLQTLPLTLSQIMDFNVQLDKIFIANSMNGLFSRFEISCYHLSDGQLMKKFPANEEEVYGTNFRPTLVASTERIQLLFSSTKVTGNSARMSTTLLELNYIKA
jgi:hypothetical protein